MKQSVGHRGVVRHAAGRWIGPCLMGFLVLTTALPAWAGRNRFFRVPDLESALEGELDGVAATTAGALLPAPARASLFTGEAAYVWSIVPDGNGGVVAATGSDGRVYAVAEDGTARRLAETFEYELFALTRDTAGRLYVSGAPNGTITRIAEDGSTETVIDLPEGLVWDLLATPDGDLYAATGESGEIYRVRADGKSERVGRIPDAHAICLEWWGGVLLCGTDARGLLATLDPKTGDVEVLYDTAQEEVVAILPLGPERVLFAANGAAASQAAGNGAETLFVPMIEVHAGGKGAGNGATLYELGPEDLVQPVWQCPEQDILCLLRAPDGSILVGTGGDGVIYSLDEQWNATRLLDLEEAQILALARDREWVFVGTGNGGAVYRLDWEQGREGIYQSRIWDAGMVSRWGVPHWIATGKGRVTMETRSGRVAEPGETWSPWEGLSGGRIASPPGRYLQFRLLLGTGGGAGDLLVRDLSIPYRGPNRPPWIEEVRVSAKAPALLGAAPGAGRPANVRQQLPGGVQVEYTLEGGNGNGAEPPDRAGLWARSLRTASWRAEDPDQDRLQFDLSLRLLGEENFLPLKEDLTDRVYTWDAAAWPEGWYELKITARDEESNPPGEGLRRERLSAPFQVDNSPPRLRDLRLEEQDDQLILSGKATDEISRIATLEFSLDGEGWRMALPIDGMLDSGSEDFRVALPRTATGRQPSVVGVRTADEVGHLASARVRAPVPRP